MATFVRASSFVILFIGFLGAFVVYQFVNDAQHDSAQKNFDERAQQIAITLERNVRRSESALISLTGLFSASDKISREQFKSFLSVVLSDQVGIQALEWIPRVSDGDRLAFEKAAERDGLSGFSFRQVIDGEMKPATMREEYFPVYFVEPLAGNKKALGFDLASNNVRKAALDRARDTGSAVSSARITLVQETAKQAGVLVFLPMYRDGAVPRTISERRLFLNGFALGVFRIGDLLESSILTSAWGQDQVIALYDLEDQKQTQPLHIIGNSGSGDLPTREALLAQLSFDHIVEIGGRQWQLVITPRGGILSNAQPWFAWLAAALVLVVLLLTGFFTQLLIHRKEDAENQVVERTKELHRVNDNLEHSLEDLAKTNEELEQFAYVASHDLKAPLRGIDNLAGFIQEDIGDRLDDESEKNFALMQNRIHRMERLLEDLLIYSRAGRKENTVEIVDLSELFSDIKALAAPPEGFEIQVQGDLCTLQAARPPLQQVLMNIIGNGIKHHDNETGTIVVEVQDTPENVVFSISDDGPGIPERFHEQIFKMFQTLKPRDELEASGMGLAVVKKVVESVNGTIDIKSTDGARGTCFSLSWPKSIGMQM